MRRVPLSYAALVIASFLYGATFVVIKNTIETLPPLSFIAWRFLIGATALLLLGRPRSAALWRHGFIGGVLLFGGYSLQTVGLARTTASNSGLITGLYVVFTPLFAAAWARYRLSVSTVGGAALAFLGLALLTAGDGFSPRSGDLLTIGAAVCYAAHIVAMSRLAHRHPVIAFTAVQLLVVSILSFGFAWPIEHLPLPGQRQLGALFFTGLAVSGVAFLFQIWAQTVVGPSRTAIILALEPAFAAATAAVALHERLSVEGWAGAALILAGIYVVVTFMRGDDELPVTEAVMPAR